MDEEFDTAEEGLSSRAPRRKDRRFLRKHWREILISITLLLVLSALVLIIWAGTEIASPSRRALMGYHHEYLANPAAHGIRIAGFTASDGTPCLVVTPDPAGNLGDRGNKIRRQLTERGFHPTSPGGITGTLVLVHGRKGRKEDYLPIAERLCASGFRCVIPDLPAHGDHPAAIATYGLREAALPARVLHEAAELYSFDARPAGLLGMSMGGSVSVHAADLPDAPWKALAVISSFDSFPKVIESQASGYIGSTLGPFWAGGTDVIYHWKSGFHLADIQPHKHAANIRIPTLIAHGTLDKVASITGGRCLFDSLPPTTPKQWIEIPGAGHDNVLITAYPIYADIAGWMLRHMNPI